MKKLLVVLLLFICGCSSRRNEYYNFHFDDYSIVVGYDDLEYIDLVFDYEIKDELDKKEKIEKIELSFWGKYFGDIDIENESNRKVKSSKGVVKRLDIYFDNLDFEIYKIDNFELSSSIKENCDAFNGRYVNNNVPACVISKQVDDKNNIIIMHGDIFNIDQDELSRIEIYVE